jgi:4-amino-4-deoxy-L-arabinose transferase-like glycosyltransferase
MNLEPRLWRPLLLFLILLAFGLRIHQLDNFGFWQDEGLTTLRSGYSITEILSNRITIQEGITKDTHPPAYYLVSHIGQALLGNSDFSYRFVSVLSGILLVPLLFQLGRRINGPGVGMLAALLAAVNPLQVWYAQEARMYTMLVLLGTAATYVLWRSLTLPRLSSSSLFARMALYFLLAGLAFYTHYTAIFLIAIQSLFWVWLLWRRGMRLLILGAAVAGLLVALPLVPATIPRLFTGAETAYYYVPPWIMLQDVVHGFGQGITSNFDRAGIKLLDVGLLLLLLVGLVGTQRIESDRRLSQIFLLVYLLAAVVGLMLGSLLKPMYLGVRHIIVGSPAFVLLAARGVSALPRQPFRLAQIAALAVLLSGSIISLLNLYYDPSFAKDDVRTLVRHVELRAGDRDLILYNNAILLPVHEHYQRRGDLPVTALPVYPYSADEKVGEQLAGLTEQYDRIWYIADPPVDGRDKDQLVESWLEENLTRLERANFWGASMRNEVIAYDARPFEIDSFPRDALHLATSWEEIPAVLGTQLDFHEPSVLPTLWIDLLWEGISAPHPDLQLRFALRDAGGDFWLDSRQPVRLPEGSESSESLLTRVNYGLQLPAGIPPGNYELLLQPWDKRDESELADWLPLTTVQIASSDLWPLEIAWPFDNDAPLIFGDALTLLGAIPAAPDVRPGHALPLSLYWRAGEDAGSAATLRYQLDLIGPDGSVLHTQLEDPGPEWLSPGDWPEEAVILEQAGLFIPADALPGRYRLRWRLWSGEESISGRPDWRPWSSDLNSLGTIVVTSWPLETKLPLEVQKVEAMFGPDIQLYGYDLVSEQVSPGEALDLTLFWQALAIPERSYHVFVHLVDADDNSIVAQSDRIPVDWLRPTNGWRPGEVLTDKHRLELPAEIGPGEYQLYAGLFLLDEDQRLPVVVSGELQPEARLLLQTIRVSP